MRYIDTEDTICAIITGGVKSAIAVIRISGNNAISICNKIFSKDISNVKTHSIHFGTINNKSKIIDEVLVGVFKNSKSFTGEESIEISCHGSIIIQNKIIELLIENGCRLAIAGEFSMRAFKNNKLDLSQAEAIADLINAESEIAHQTALNQMKGGFSKELSKLRNELIDFSSLITLELDFSEEDIEFANKEEFKKLIGKIKPKLQNLIESFKIGNVIQNGIPIVILGSPNVGKSTLLNKLINDDRAIVSDIPGTTRDSIEESVNIKGMNFKFIDTAGIRQTNDKIEKLGIIRSLEKAKQASVILYIIDGNEEKQLNEYKRILRKYNNKVILVINKCDLSKEINIQETHIKISAKYGNGIEKLKNNILSLVNFSNISNLDSIVTNHRHYSELKSTLNEIIEIEKSIENNESGDLLSIHINKALYHLGSITGEISTDDLLGNIFSKFCIGK